MSEHKVRVSSVSIKQKMGENDVCSVVCGLYGRYNVIAAASQFFLLSLSNL